MEEKQFCWRRELPYVLIAAAAAITVRAACVPYAEASWDSDGANSCLLALHHSQGLMPVFWYSQGYNGSIEALCAAPFVLALGPTVQAMAIAMTIICGILAVLLYRLGYEVGGRGGALLGTAAYAACSLPHVDNLSGINHSYNLMLVFGMVTLLVGRRFLEAPSRGRALGLGAVVGLALFNNPQGVSFVAPLVLVLWLRGRSIPRLLGRDGAASGALWWPRAIVGALLLGIAVTVGMAAAEMTVLKLGALEVSLSKPGKYVMRLVLGLGVVIGAMELQLARGRRNALIALGVAGVLGVAIGVAPAIAFKITRAVHPAPVKSTPAGLDPTFVPHHLGRLWKEQAGELLFNQLPMGHYDTAPHERAKWFPGNVHRVVRGVGWALLLAMLGGAVYVRRRDWLQVLSLRPPERLDMGWLLGLHFAGALSMYLMFPRHDVYPKYLMATMVPLAGLVAASYAWTLKRQAKLAHVGAALWVVVAAFTCARSLGEAHGRWAAPDHEWHEVRHVLQQIDERGVKHGYANYWYGWKINYLSGERVILREWPRVPELNWNGQRPMLTRYHQRIDRALANGEKIVFVLARTSNWDEGDARKWFERSWRDKRVEVFDTVEAESYSLYFCQPRK